MCMEADFGFNFNKFLSFSFVGFNWCTDSKMGLYFQVLETRAHCCGHFGYKNSTRKLLCFFTFYVFQVTIRYLSNLK